MIVRRVTRSGLNWHARRLGRSALRRWPPPSGRSWAIGVHRGPSPLCLEAVADQPAPVLTAEDVTDIPADFVADPFVVEHRGTWHMFFEVMNRRLGKGEIAHATSADGIAWHYDRSVLAERLHLSYPCVFEWQGEFFMVPETRSAREVRLYRAGSFPGGWRPVAVLLKGFECADATVFRHGERWWMFAEGGTIRNSTLRLFWSDDLFHGWGEHPRSPIVSGNAHIARPGGRVISDGGRLYRFAQDCDPDYGLNVRAFEITQLTPGSYVEQPASERPILEAGDQPWNAGGMHHVDAHQTGDGGWFAAVDGWSRR